MPGPAFNSVRTEFGRTSLPVPVAASANQVADPVESGHGDRARQLLVLVE